MDNAPVTAQILPFAKRKAAPIVTRYEDGQMGYVRTEITRPGIDGRIILHGLTKAHYATAQLQGEINSRLLEDLSEGFVNLHPDISQWQGIIDHSGQTKPVSVTAMLNASQRWNQAMNERDKGSKTVIIQKGNVHLRRFIQSLYAQKTLLFAGNAAEAFSQIDAQFVTALSALNLPRSLAQELGITDLRQEASHRV